MTNVAESAAVAVSSMNRMQELSHYISEEVMTSVRIWDPFDGWDIPFVHIPGLHALKSDFGGLVISFLLVLLLGRIALLSQSKRNLWSRPHGLYNCLEFFVQFIRDDICIPAMGAKVGARLTPQMCSLFMLILAMNLLGACPMFDTATSNINVTTALMLVTLSLIIWAALYQKGFRGIVALFFPPDMPLPIRLALAPIELMSFLCRLFALTVRLFANMLAGHIVLFSLLGMVYLFGMWAWGVVVLAVGFQLYELFIALLQAFIFTLLSATFIGLALGHGEHAEHDEAAEAVPEHV